MENNGQTRPRCRQDALRPRTAPEAPTGPDYCEQTICSRRRRSSAYSRLCRAVATGHDMQVLRRDRSSQADYFRPGGQGYRCPERGLRFTRSAYPRKDSRLGSLPSTASRKWTMSRHRLTDIFAKIDRLSKTLDNTLGDLGAKEERKELSGAIAGIGSVKTLFFARTASSARFGTSSP